MQLKWCVIEKEVKIVDGATGGEGDESREPGQDLHCLFLDIQAEYLLFFLRLLHCSER